MAVDRCSRQDAGNEVCEYACTNGNAGGEVYTSGLVCR
jgi:hypothetical protein